MNKLYRILSLMFISLGLIFGGVTTTYAKGKKKNTCIVKKVKKAVKKAYRKTKKKIKRTAKKVKKAVKKTCRKAKRKVKRSAKKAKRAVVKAGCAAANKVMDKVAKARNKLSCSKTKKVWVKGHYKKGNKHHTKGHWRTVKR